MKTRTVECPSCPVELQPLAPESTYPDQAQAIARQLLGTVLPGPIALFPIGPLIVHHAVAHRDRDLAKYLDAYYDGRQYP